MKKLDTSIKDAILIFLVVFIIAHTLTYYDGFELLIEFVEEYEEYELDEFILILFVGSFGGFLYSIRRYLEVKKLKQKLDEYSKELEKDNLEKESILLEQTKMAFLGEMIRNIAHQWRQPLSGISTSVSGLKLEKEMGVLNDEILDRTLNNIMDTTLYLSDTIDSFRDYMQENSVKKSFDVNKNINKAFSILEGPLKATFIKLVLDLKNEIIISGYSNELTQVIMNIIYNAKDAHDITQNKDRYIFISTKKENEKLSIEIYDNANGIDEKIIGKVFEPYFTTKHQYKGTGLGLFMSYKIINERMKGELSVKNIEFEYKGKSYRGAKFLITIPIK